MKKIVSLSILFLLSITFIQGQIMDLEYCIETAIQNSIDNKLSENLIKSSEINFNQAKSNRLPFLDLDYNLGQSYGRSIDPYSNDYVNQELTFSNIGISGNTILFNGFRIKNEISRAKLGLTASEAEQKELEDIIRLNVTQAYIAILNNQALLELANQSAITTRDQLNQFQSMFDEGSGDPATISDLQGQLASDELQIINIKNDIQQAKLQLSQIMNIPFNPNVEFENISDEPVKEDITPDELFALALQNFQAFEARELRIKEAEAQISVERSSLMPTIFAFANLSSNFSSAARQLSLTGNEEQATGDYINFNSEIVPVFSQQDIFTESNINYSNQFLNNFSPNFGLGINVPIMNRLAQRNSIKRSRIDLDNSKLQLDLLKQQFRQAIEQVLTDRQATISRITSLENQVEAFEESFRINSVKLENGLSVVLEYIISKNRLDSAKQLLANAQFSLSLQELVIDYYKGI